MQEIDAIGRGWFKIADITRKKCCACSDQLTYNVPAGTYIRSSIELKCIRSGQYLFCFVLQGSVTTESSGLLYGYLVLIHFGSLLCSRLAVPCKDALADDWQRVVAESGNFLLLRHDTRSSLQPHRHHLAWRMSFPWLFSWAFSQSSFYVQETLLDLYFIGLQGDSSKLYW